MYWFSVPAILKDWIDKVLTKGFAYTDTERFSEGLFRVRLFLKVVHVCVCKCILLTVFYYVQNKRALLSFTTGTQASMFAAKDAVGDFNYTLCPLLVLHPPL